MSRTRTEEMLAWAVSYYKSTGHENFPVKKPYIHAAAYHYNNTWRTRDHSIKLESKYLPRGYQYTLTVKRLCKHCDGMGHFWPDDSNVYEDCKDCNGTGREQERAAITANKNP